MQANFWCCRNFSSILRVFRTRYFNMFTCKPCEGAYQQLIDKYMEDKHYLYEFNPGKFPYPYLYKQYAQTVLDMPVRKDDIWLISFPRTGSTWCQEMVWLIGNDLDFEKNRSTFQFKLAPLLEASALSVYEEVLKEICMDSVKYVHTLSSPRYIKTHITYQLLPTQLHQVKPKIIYVMRNPKDQCVSYYYYCKLLHNFKLTFEEFCEIFLNDELPCGNLFKHYMEFWTRRHEKNILIIKYEDMKRDTRGTLKKIAEFMEKSLSDEDLTNLEDFLSVKKMKDSKAYGLTGDKPGKHCYGKGMERLIRKGEIGDWKNHMSPEMAKRFDEWIEKNTQGTGLFFD